MDNPLRNEVKVTLDGKEYTMRATFEAICAIESDLRMNLVPIIGNISQHNIGVRQCAVVIFHGLRGYGDNGMTLSEVGDLVMMEGAGAVANAITDFLNKGMDGVKVGKSVEVEKAPV